VYKEDLYGIKVALGYMWPEITLAVIAIALILLSLFRSNTRAFYYLTITGVIVHLLLSFFYVRGFSDSTIANDMFVIGASASLFKLLMSFAALFTVIMSRRERRMEYYFLIVTLLFGADLLVISKHFISIVISMEIISISSYVLVAGANPDKQRAEAAWKFFIFGSTATAVMIFGMSYLFGASAFMGLPGHFAGVDPVMLTIGGLMTLAGLFFKMTAAPFHLWAPDVYQATPSPVVAYLSVVPKLAGLFVVMRLLSGFPARPIDWSAVIAGVALLSIVIGTLAAIAQKEAKRMMAYSTVAQAGFLLAAVSAFSFSSSDAFYAVTFYAFIFVFMNYAVFIVIQQKEEAGGSTLYEDFSGMGSSAIIPAVTITVAFISLAGLPPVAGFTAKLLVFTTVWAKYAATGSFTFLALFVIGLVATVVSLFFYLKIPFYLFFRQSEQKDPLKISQSTNFFLLFLVGVLFALFFIPSLFDWLGGWVIRFNGANFVL
jgi:NADH-quinone oxidoreductase subunit N